MKLPALVLALALTAHAATVLRIACGSSTAVTDAQGNVWVYRRPRMDIGR